MDKELEPEVIDAIQKGKKIQAIKRLRESRNIGLKESKDIIDAYLNDTHPNDSDLNNNNTHYQSVEKLNSNNGLVIVMIVIGISYMAYKYFS